jgi:hypothetical protein
MIESTEFGQSSTIDVEIDDSVNQFIIDAYGFEVTDEDVHNYALTKHITDDQARIELTKQNDKKKQNIPDANGNIPSNSGQTNKQQQKTSTGGLKTFLKAFAKLIYKILGFFGEQFIYLIKPIKKLIKQLLYNFEPDSNNPTPLPHIVFNNMMIASTTGTPLQVTFIKNLATTIIDQLDTLNTILNKIIKPIVSVLKDIASFVEQQIIKPLGNFNIPLPSINIPFGGIKLPSFDLKGSFTNPNSPFNLENLISAGLAASSVVGLISNIDDAIKDLIDCKKKGNPATSKSINLDELNFIQNLGKDPITQRKYIMAIRDVNRLDEFYREPFIKNDNYNDFSYTFDFFKTFDYDDTDNNGTKINGLYKFLEKSKLYNNTDFIKKFYEILKNYDLNSIPEMAKDFVNTTNSNAHNGVYNNIDELFFKKLNDSKYINTNDFLQIIKRSFDLNFWNSKLNTDNKIYIHGKISDKNFIYTDYDYKKFKLAFYEIIPDDCLQYFATYTSSYIVDFNEVDQYNDGYLLDFNQIISLSNDRYIGGNSLKEIGGIQFKGILDDNTFRKLVGLPVKSDGKLFSKYDANGLPILDETDNSDCFDKLKSKLPGLAAWTLFSVIFFGKVILFVLQLLFSFLEKILGILFDLIKLSIGGAFKKIGELVKSLLPSKDFFQKLVKTALGSVVASFIESAAKKLVAAGVSAVKFIAQLTKTLNNILTKAIPHFLFNIIIQLFSYLVKQLTSAIPIIPSPPTPKWT